MKNIGLVLSGGMAKGAYQIGALRAISEFLPARNFTYISAASIGSLNAYAFLTNQLDLAQNLWIDATENQNTLRITSVLRSALIENTVKNILSDASVENHFYIPLLDIRKRTLSYFDISGSSVQNTEKYLNASVALPVFSAGIKINGTVYFDGAMVDNIPVFPLTGKNLDYLILVYFDNQSMIFENQEFDRRIIKLTFPDPTLKSSVRLSRAEVIRTIDAGYSRSRFVLDYVFANGTGDIDEILERISRLNSGYPARKVFLSGDILVNQMNKVTERLARKNIVTREEQRSQPQRTILSAEKV